MLLGYGANNIWSFKEWMQIDLELNKLVPKDIYMNLPAATVLCFKGANASGKTNGLKVLSFLNDFIINSFNYKPEAPIYYDKYFHNEEPSEFYLQFEIESHIYQYEAILAKDHIICEKLLKNDKNIFLRNNNEIIENKLYDGSIEVKLRNNASFISTLHQYGIQEIEEIYNYFSVGTVLNVGYVGFNSIDFYDYRVVSLRYHENPEIFEKVKETIKRFDTGVDSIEIKNTTDEAGNIIYYPIFIHTNDENKKIGIRIEMESKGTQTLFRILLNFFITLNNGGLLVLDEMDEYLDPEILPYLLDFYIKNENNPKHAQLICSIHSPDILDISGKYRTYIFKKEKNESICYRLDELEKLKLRNDRSISKEFRKHQLGGFPEIE